MCDVISFLYFQGYQWMSMGGEQIILMHCRCIWGLRGNWTWVHRFLGNNCGCGNCNYNCNCVEKMSGLLCMWLILCILLSTMMGGFLELLNMLREMFVKKMLL